MEEIKAKVEKLKYLARLPLQILETRVFECACWLKTTMASSESIEYLLTDVLGDERKNIIQKSISKMDALPLDNIGVIAELYKKRMNRRGYTATELMNIKFPDIVWIIPDFLPVGLMLLAGKPKTGKSRLCLHIADAATRGRPLFNSLHVEPIGILYLALEDKEQRFQERMSEILNGTQPSDKFHVYFDWSRSNEGGIQELDSWLKDHPDVKLVIIDVLAMIRANAENKKGMYSYYEDYTEIMKFKKVAEENSIAIIMIHHSTKLQNADDPYDAMAGTTGLPAAADTLAVLRSDRTGNKVELQIAGRDVLSNCIYLKYNNDDASWVTTMPITLPKRSKERQAIIDVLSRNAGLMGSREIAALLGRSDEKGYNAVRQLLHQMKKKGEITQTEAGYKLPDPFQDKSGTEGSFPATNS